jgi:hypothetical protein
MPFAVRPVLDVPKVPFYDGFLIIVFLFVYMLAFGGALMPSLQSSMSSLFASSMIATGSTNFSFAKTGLLKVV